MRQPDSEKFALLRRCERIWAIASIHGDVERLHALPPLLLNTCSQVR